VNVAIQSPNEADIGIGINKDLEVHQSPQSRIAKDQYSLEDDYGPGPDVSRFGPARVRLVVVDGLLYRFAGTEGFDVVDQKVDVESVRVIEVDVVAQLYRHITQVAIIRILLQIDDARGAYGLYYSVGDGGFSGARSSSYTDHHTILILRGRPISSQSFQADN
jgi:hypothetical protein